MQKKFIFLLLLSINLVTSSFLKGQSKKIDTHIQLWPQYFNTTKLNSSWSLSFDCGYRWIDAFEERQASLIRVGANYKLTPKLAASGGIAYFFYYPNSHGVKAPRAEYRPWEQLAYTFNIKKLQVLNRFRAEQRFTSIRGEDELQLVHRLRYMISFQLPLKGMKVKQGVPYISFADEIMLNYGKEVIYNHLDQHRSQLGFGYGVTNNLNIVLSYLYVWQKRNLPESYYNIHSFRLSFFHQIDLSKKTDN